VTDGAARDDRFASLDVDRVTKEDGRYLLYYSWPSAVTGGDASTPPQSGGQGTPWTPESGPDADV
jgi:hypothetical protein